jgi:hypothetical protein
MSTRQQLARLLPLVLLIVLMLVGLRGAVAAPRWDGPLKGYGVGIGIAVEVVFVVCLGIVLRRERAERRAVDLTPYSAEALYGDIKPATKLRFVLKYVLIVGIILGVFVLITNLHLHFFAKPKPTCLPGKKSTLADQCVSVPTAKPSLTPAAGTGGSGAAWGGDIVYALLIVVLVAAIAVSVWWALRQRRLTAPLIAPRPLSTEEELRDAVEEGRAALDTLGDDRAAIIACYVAMERRLAERGTERSAADTPDELLAKAVAAGTVRGDSAGRLTELFYEARFSTHPLAGGQRAAASAALDALAAELKAKLKPEPAPTSAAGTDKPGGGWV